jgi:hypothetical protein
LVPPLPTQLSLIVFVRDLIEILVKIWPTLHKISTKMNGRKLLNIKTKGKGELMADFWHDDNKAMDSVSIRIHTHSQTKHRQVPRSLEKKIQKEVILRPTTIPPTRKRRKLLQKPNQQVWRPINHNTSTNNTNKNNNKNNPLHSIALYKSLTTED